MDFATPLFANALEFAFEKATTEGKVTIVMLVVVSLFSWTVIITKGRQLFRAQRAGKRFFTAYRRVRDPLELFHRKEEFVGAPGFEVYTTGAEELTYQLKNNPVRVRVRADRGAINESPAVRGAETDFLAKSMAARISPASFDSVKVVVEREVSAQALSLEKGMIIRLYS